MERIPLVLKQAITHLDSSNQPTELPTTGRLAGVDYGTKRIGIAITDVGQSIASPLTGYERKNAVADAEWFAKLANREDIQAWIVGLPLYPSGDESPKSIEAREFGSWLQRSTGLLVRFFDERYSSAQADVMLAVGELTKKRRTARRDMLAAQVILASFLESRDRSERAESMDD